MSFVGRLFYAMYILIAVTMMVMLLVSVSQGIGLVRGWDVQSVIASPIYFGSLYALAFAVAPVLHERMPISGDRPVSEPPTKKPFGYAVRVVALAAVGLLLALTASFLVYLFNKLA